MLFDELMVNKVRFEYKGIIGLEDLYDLSSDDLNELYKKYNKEYEGNGLIKEKKDGSILKLKLDAIKHVFEYKEEVQKQNEERMKKEETRKRLMEAIKEKEIQSLKNMSKEDLEKMLNDF